jgi:hypothetical protein
MSRAALGEKPAPTITARVIDVTHVRQGVAPRKRPLQESCGTFAESSLSYATLYQELPCVSDDSVLPKLAALNHP